MNKAGLEEFILDQVALADFFCYVIQTQRGIVLAFEHDRYINEFDLVGKFFTKVF